MATIEPASFITLTADEHEEMHAKILSLDNQVYALGNALLLLKKAAQEAVDDYLSPSATYNSMEQSMAGLAEAIPCDDCLQAPCVCP